MCCQAKSWSWQGRGGDAQFRYLNPSMRVNFVKSAKDNVTGLRRDVVQHRFALKDVLQGFQ